MATYTPVIDQLIKVGCQVQIVEASAFGVRSVIMTLVHPASQVRFMLFPMVHIGERDFYHQVQRRLAECGLILLEGVKSRRVRHLTLIYSLVANARRLGLVTQRQALDLAQLRDRIVRSDMDGREFDRRWSLLAGTVRAALLVMAPLIGLAIRWLASREQIGRHFGVDLLPSSDEILADDDLPGLMNILLHARDQVLLRHVGDVAVERRTIAIVYGAAHMRAVIRQLLGPAGYRIERTEFVTVMSY
jgi:hypothetical protein